MKQVYAVIMAGGAGTRFWPASRELLPKQLLALGPTANSLLRETSARIEAMVPSSRQTVVTAARLAEKTMAELPHAAVLSEPAPRNTAPCVGWATWTIAARDSEAVIMVLPSDHVVSDVPEFQKTLAVALASAAEGHIVTIGIKPTRAETGYGYIELESEVAAGVYRAARFVEKPNRARAEEYVASKRFLWNAGMFFFRAQDMERALRTHLPELAQGLDALRAAPEKLADLFPSLPSVSIDTGVMEKLSELRVVPGDFGWSDVGSWESAWDLGQKDENKNVLPEDAITVEASGNLVRQLGRMNGKLVALVGVQDLVVVDTEDALLIMPKSRAQDVRAVVEALKTRKNSKHL
jgi:mannose-1-phosphate guanylyltransferase